MEHLKAKLEKLQLEAEDYELISNLTSDMQKQASCAKLAALLKAMALDIQAAIDARSRQDAA